MTQHLIDSLGLAHPGPQQMTNDVILDAEVRVVFDHRMAEIEWHRHQALTIARNQVQAAFDMLHKIVEINLALEQKDRPDVEWAIGGFCVYKCRVL